jgi:hypothetical protein
MAKRKNTVPSAPLDVLERGRVFAGDGRKREDKEFVGAKTPDVEPERPPRQRKRRR